MYLFVKHSRLKIVNTFVRLYSMARKNHYDVLNLRKNCSDKEIKQAFIKMSKEFHPDKNKDVRAQEKFVQIVEAYNVLSKPSTRAQYDSASTEAYTYQSYTNNPFVHKTRPPNYRTNTDNFYYESTKQSESSHQPESHQWYYGMAGIKKMPNYYIIGICCGIACIALVVQLYVIRNLYTSQRQLAQERSKQLAEELEKVRNRAKDNGNELQTRLLLEKIVSGANPTVTTASLGQALASEKK